MPTATAFRESHSSLAMPTSIYWQEGIHVTYNEFSFCVESANHYSAPGSPDLEGVVISTYCPLDEHLLLGFVVDQIDSLIEEWFPGVCSSCCVRPFLLPWETIVVVAMGDHCCCCHGRRVLLVPWETSVNAAKVDKSCCHGRSVWLLSWKISVVVVMGDQCYCCHGRPVLLLSLEASVDIVMGDQSGDVMGYFEHRNT